MIIAQAQARSGPTVIKVGVHQSASSTGVFSFQDSQKACIAEVPSRQKNKTGSSIVGPSRFVHGSVPASDWRGAE